MNEVIYLSKQTDKVKIKWHPAFCSATEFDLRYYSEVLDFFPEYQLSKEPLIMDLLIIEKLKDVVIDNDIAKLFRRYNIVEYKSPDDGLTIDDFYKTIAYAALFKSSGDRVDKYPADQITVSLFREKEPVKLFKELKELGMSIEKVFEGIYHIKGNTLFPVQVIVTGDINSKTHPALKVLSKNAKYGDVNLFLADANIAENQDNNIDAILQASIPANEDLYETIRRENPMCEALRRLMRDDLEAAEAKGKTETALEMAAIMIEEKEPVAKIQRYTKVNLDKLQELSKQLGIALVM